MKNTALKFGLISGAIVATMMSFSFLILDIKEFGYGNAEILGFASMIIAMSMIFLGIREQRNKHLGGFISFRSAFMTGVYITLICTVIYVTNWMIASAIKPELIDGIADMYKESLLNSGGDEAEIQKKIIESEQQFATYKDNAMMRIAYTIMEIFPVGILITLISAFILKKKAV